MLADPAAAARLGQVARETVLQRYNLQDCLAKQRALVERAADRDFRTVPHFG
jgi:hypothetical protein